MSNQTGWKLMPVLHDGKAPCTHEMADAFDRAYEECSKKHGFYESMNAGYNAMVAASPTPPASTCNLTDLHKELGLMVWSGMDDGWDRAIESVRERILEIIASTEQS